MNGTFHNRGPCQHYLHLYESTSRQSFKPLLSITKTGHTVLNFYPLWHLIFYTTTIYIQTNFPTWRKTPCQHDCRIFFFSVFSQPSLNVQDTFTKLHWSCIRHLWFLLSVLHIRFWCFWLFSSFPGFQYLCISLTTCNNGCLHSLLLFFSFTFHQ